MDSSALDEDLFVPLDSHFTVELPSTDPEPNVIVFRACQGDGSYPVWIGRTDDRRGGCVVIDFQLHSVVSGRVGGMGWVSAGWVLGALVVGIVVAGTVKRSV